MMKREFIEQYCLAAVNGAASQRSQLKPDDLVADAEDLWASIEEATVAQADTTQMRRQKRPAEPKTPQV